MAAVTLSALTKEFAGGVRALDTLDLTVADGEFFALLGPSGCGKTTLLRTVAGLESPTSGEVRIGDRDVTGLAPGARDVAMVFQDYALFPHMTVRDNIAYPLRIRRQSRPERAARAGDVGAHLGLAGLMDRRPAALSGGQQQRVALARAMACHPSVFLLDEPLSNLDARLRLEARTFLKRLQRELAVTTVFVTHDQAEALALADRIAVMDAGQVRQVGTPREVFGRPANTFVANFIGSTPMNLLPGVVGDGAVSVAGGALALPGGAAVTAAAVAEKRVIVGVRPEYVSLSTIPVPGALTGEVSIIEHLGAVSLVTVEADGALVGATVPEDAEPVPGSAVWLTPAPGRVLIYRESDGVLVS
ncbi:MAG TPA: ABC transporter ATP-binding protein [Planosporangium sp.]|jgi:multiple sugar transport system ATP-binding protein|nr:ABC transporter ATP-binding protein [Planosporangium sp.]